MLDVCCFVFELIEVFLFEIFSFIDIIESFVIELFVLEFLFFFNFIIHFLDEFLRLLCFKPKSTI